MSEATSRPGETTEGGAKSKPTLTHMVQPHIARMAGYQPGEQPQEGRFVKLNTNENPYPPSPQVASAVQAALGARLRYYPDPMGGAFRRAAAALHEVNVDQVLTGNGSDDLLTILFRAFVGHGDTVTFPTPSYILYQTLAELQNARPAAVPFGDEWDWDPRKVAATNPKLVILANPNSPSGTWIPPETVALLAHAIDCPLVVDEAYAGFSRGDCMELARTIPNVLVTRSLSKSHGLAGLRAGYLVGDARLVAELVKVKDSYNCDTLSIVGAAAALADTAYYADVARKVIATRERLSNAMRARGCKVTSSQANFVWCQGGCATGDTYFALKERGILVRLMRYPGYDEGLRISVGTEEEIDILLAALDALGHTPKS